MDWLKDTPFLTKERGFLLQMTSSRRAFMPIRIKCRDKPRYMAQPNEYKELIASLAIALMACYADRKPNFRVLYGSI